MAKQTPSIKDREAETSQRLRAALVKAATRDAESMEALRVAVRGFTVALRDAGNPPEQVLISLKAVVNNRALVAIPNHASDWRCDALREKLSTWCIKEFFADNRA